VAGADVAVAARSDEEITRVAGETIVIDGGETAR
jgi:hypothetical protein